MREQSYTFTEPFTIGLRTDSRATLGSPSLSSCRGLRPTRLGLMECSVPSAGPSTEYSTWPYPQMFRAGDSVYVVKGANFYEATLSGGSWTKTQIEFKSYYNRDTRSSPIEDGLWHLADFQLGWLATNGSSIVGNVVDRSTGVATLYANSAYPPATVCTHRGRMLSAGYSDGFWTSQWRDELELKTSGVGFSMSYDFGPNFVCWSQIGGGDLFVNQSLTVGRYGSDSLSTSGYDEDFPMWVDLIRNNELGWMPVAGTGEVYQLLPLDDFVVALGSFGVAVLTMISSPVPTYGLVNITDVGTSNRSAGAVGKGRVVFVDKRGWVNVIRADKQLDTYDFSEYLDGLDPINVLYDPSLDQFYIGDESTTYVLTKSGLGESNVAPTYFVPYLGQTYYNTPDTADSTFEFTLDWTDMSVPSMKFVQTLQVIGRGISDVEFKVEGRARNNEYETSWIRANDSYAAQPCIAADQFKVSVRGTAAENTNIGGLRVGWTLADARQIRGQYA